MSSESTLPESPNDSSQDGDVDVDAETQEARLWIANGWTARVIKNEDDDGWAVSMTSRGQAEPALVGPWTMGRDKKNPKPLDSAAFRTLVKTAAEVVRRHEQQLHATLHKSVTVDAPSVAGASGGRITVLLDIVPSEDDAYAVLAAEDSLGERLAEVQVPASFKLNAASATAWIESGYRKPR
ncbi:hypothetical protein BH09PSE5_BH09PSE5_40870 [soil metagenome]